MSAREDELLSKKEAAHYEGISERTMTRRMRDGKVSSLKVKGEGRRKGLFEIRIHYSQLSEKAREAFLQDRGLLPEAKAEPKPPDNLKLQLWQRRAMLKREAIVREYLAAEGDIPPGKKGQFQKTYSKMHNISPQTLRRHLYLYSQFGREALAPNYPGGSARVLTKEKKEFIYNTFLKPRGPSARETWEKLCDAFKDKGPLPTYRTVAAYINKACPKDLQLLIRDTEAYNRKHSPYVPRKRPENVNDLWYSDSKQFDIFIRHHRKAVRLWVTIFLDAASGKIVGWAVTITPDADAIAMAFVKAVREHGIPKAVYIDRGKAYKSFKITGQKIKVETIHPLKDSKIERIAGIFGEMGVGVIWAAPYNAKEKGAIEATFNYFTSRMRGWLGFCGHNTKVRPKNLEALIKSGKLLALEELSAKIDELIHNRNAHPHSTTGKIPNDCYKDFTPVIPSENLLAFLLMDVHQCKVRSSAVKIRETMYRHDDMWRLNGEMVEVRRDPKDLRQAALIYKGEFFCTAPEIQMGDHASPFTKENVKMARRIKRSESQFKKKHIEQGGYIEDPLKLAVHLSEKDQEIEVVPRAPKAKVVSLHKKERLAKKVAKGLREAPSEAGAGGRGKVVKMPKEDSLENKIKHGLFGI